MTSIYIMRFARDLFEILAILRLCVGIRREVKAAPHMLCMIGAAFASCLSSQSGAHRWARMARLGLVQASVTRAYKPVLAWVLLSTRGPTAVDLRSRARARACVRVRARLRALARARARACAYALARARSRLRARARTRALRQCAGS